MANTVAIDFENFCSNLIIRNTADISYRYQRITQRLNLDLRGLDSKLDHSFYVGSYGRDTGITGLHDLDVLYTIPYKMYERYDSYNGNGQSALLQNIRSTIALTYPATEVKGDGQVVVVSFADGMKFEVVPGILLSNDAGYFFPDSNNGGSWKTTNPKAEQNAMKTINQATNGNLRRLCRMTRAWKARNGVPISGFLIDTLAASFIQTWAHRDRSYLYYDYMTRDFMAFLAAQDPKQTYWRAPGSRAYVYRKGNFESIASAAHTLSIKAIDQDSRGHSAARNQTFREIYGNCFPV
ncbi:SMODS domain-containing nucleotidyltransferase [Deinococcus aquaticus]|uniref:SMODS domain-containing nucleotidyltransferase n=1 Tax=Deinococcus aquaticus TaxID=328692 RepID=UPI003F71C422